MTEASRAREGAARRERAERIMDAAGELLLRWGYRRITMDDVANEAGVGKGTVYLHWKTREDLFQAVLLREVALAVGELVAAIERDPEAALLHELTRALYLSVMRRPLGRALFTGDLEVLGKLAKLSDRAFEARGAAALLDYLRLLQGHGLLRTDLTLDELYYAHDATVNGFFLTESSGQGLSLERRADVLAGAVRRTLEADARPTPEALRAIAERTIQIYTGLAGLTLDQIRQAYE